MENSKKIDENTVYYTVYNLDLLSYQDRQEIDKITSIEMERITKMGFVENVKGLKDIKNKFGYDITTWNGYLSENLIAKLDKTMGKKKYENGEKYDFIKEKNGRKTYIDVKTMIVGEENKEFNKIKEKKLAYFIQAKQIDSDLTLKHIKDKNLPMEAGIKMGAKQFCDKNGIDYKDYYISPVYFHPVTKVLIRLSGEMFRLDKILNSMKIKFTNIPNTKVTDKMCYFVFENIYDKELTELKVR